MSNQELENRYTALEDHILTLLSRYIIPHSNPLENPNDYKLDVNVFCVLCHAAFEEFIEDITLYSVDRIELEFNSRPRRFSYSTLCLLHFDGSYANLNNESKWSDLLNDYMYSRIHQRKIEIGNYARNENHGIDIKYLMKLLLPIGIDLPKDPKITNSLQILKNIRGAYAHSYARNTNPISPEDASNVVFDVLNMVAIIKDKAVNMNYYIL